MRSGYKLIVTALVAIVMMAVILYANYLAPKGFEVLFKTYPGLLIGMSAGFFGAAFSMLVQSQRRMSQGTLEDSDVAAEWDTLIIRSAFGVAGATMIYFFFESGLLEGSLWPELDKLGAMSLAGETGFRVPNQHVCLLVIWCFVAGFSETFVPNILVRTESRSNG